MGNGNIDVGNESSPRSLKAGREGTSSGLCGAMSQQGGEFRGNVSAPQKFLHLVGCRDRKAAQMQTLQKQVLETTRSPHRVKR